MTTMMTLADESACLCTIFLVFTFGAKIQKKKLFHLFAPFNRAALLNRSMLCLVVCLLLNLGSNETRLAAIVLKRGGEGFANFDQGRLPIEEIFFCQLFSYFISSLFFYT